MRSITETEKLLTTPLYQWHCDHNATMAPFGAYSLPLWYEKGAKAEHLSVLSSAGLFDTSHMTALVLKGTDSLALLQYFFSRDLSCLGGKKDKTLPDGKGAYGVFLNAEGHLLDDSIIYRVAPETYFICLNSGKGQLITDHLGNYQGDFSLKDLTSTITKLDIQGPQAAKILTRVLHNSGALFKDFAPFSCKGGWEPLFTAPPDIQTKSGIPVFIARSGYTGEFGFELFSSAADAIDLWQEIITAGREYDLLPCGLASRDSLRTGAGLPLAGQDIGPWPFVNNPWTFALPYTNDKTGFSKDFLGSAALLDAYRQYTYAFAGYDLRKIDQNTAQVLGENDEKLGRVLTCVTDMAVDRMDSRILSSNSPARPKSFTPKGLSCGFLHSNSPLAYGSHVILQDKRRKIKVEIVQTIRPDRSAHSPLQNFL